MSTKKKASKPKPGPTHGYCAVCYGPIEKGMQWTFTRQLNRVHLDPDRCVQVLNPELIEMLRYE